MSVVQKVRDVVMRRPRRLSMEEYAAKLIRQGKGPDGRIVVNPVPIAPPIGWKKQPSMVEIVREMVRGERLAEEARAAGHETFEESEDFEVGDEPELLRSAWENQFDPDLSELMKAGQEVLKAKEVPEDIQPKPPGAAPLAPDGGAAPGGAAKPPGERSEPSGE